MNLGEHQPVSGEDQQELSTVDVLVQELASLDRSHDSNFRIKIQFVNSTRKTVSIRWLDFDGAEVTYSNLQPGARYNVNSFLTHPWVFYDQQTSEKLSVLLCRQRVSKFEASRTIKIYMQRRMIQFNHIRAISRGEAPLTVFIVQPYFPIRSLRHICMKTIRKHLQHVDKINSLEIPENLKSELISFTIHSSI